MNRLLGVQRGGIWLIVTLESEDEAQIRSMLETDQNYPIIDSSRSDLIRTIDVPQNLWFGFKVQEGK